MTNSSSQGLPAQLLTHTTTSLAQRILSWCSSNINRSKVTDDHIDLETPLPEITDQLALRVLEIKDLISLAHKDHRQEAYTLLTAQEYYRSAIANAVDSLKVKNSRDFWNVKTVLVAPVDDVDGIKRQISTEFAVSAGFGLHRFFYFRENAARDYEQAMKARAPLSGPLI